MIRLDDYKDRFEEKYPRYADEPYQGILLLVSAIKNHESVSQTLASDEAANIVELLLPMIRMKNYKSQIPFPENPLEAARLIAEIKNATPEVGIVGRGAELCKDLLNQQGFQLPTVSAVFHFCHPKTYPIVDRNIGAACRFIFRNYREEFNHRKAPKLPATTTSPQNKISKYQSFIEFISRLKEVHNKQHGTTYEFRDLDKALMVLGDDELKKRAP